VSTDNNMKILYLITKSNWGGAQKYVYELATATTGHDLEVVVAYGGGGFLGDGPPGELAHKLTLNGIRGIHVPELAREVGIIRELKTALALYRLLRHERPDILHISSSKAGGIGAFAARLARVPRIVFTSHGLAYDEPWRSPLARALMWLSTWATFLLCHAVIVISTDTLKRARQLPFCKRKIKLVFNGIAPPDFLSRTEARAKLATLAGTTFAENTLLIGSIAELTANKNHLRMLEALATLPRELPFAYLLIGDGEERDSLLAHARERGLADRYFLLGKLPEAGRLLSGLDMFTLTSLKEGLPYVLMEAGHAKLPVLASNIPGVTDIIEENKNGLLAPSNDVVAIGAALRTLLKDSALRDRLATALQEKVRVTFSVERMVRETLKIYKHQ